MRSVFDEHKVERPTRDTELTLGSGTLVAIFCGLVLLCGLCFGMGYAVGHRDSGPNAITTPQPAPDQEPLQASGSIPKPSAIAQVPIAAPPPADGEPAAAAPGTGAPSATPSAAVPAAPSTPASQPLVHPALPASTSEPAQASAPAAVHPAIGPQFMVQIAAVSNPEDASVLMAALRKRNYPVSVRRDPGDNLLHVRIGPFTSRAIADQWRDRLLNDGYNAVVQQSAG
ncbi:MAG: SPOR domain-containing protein [Acidobacteriota bacterium]